MAAMETQTEAQTVSEAAPASETAPMNALAATINANMRTAVKQSIVQYFRDNAHRSFPDILKDFESAEGLDQELVDEVILMTPISEFIGAASTKNGSAKKATPTPAKAKPTADDLTPHQQADIVKFVNQWESGSELKTKDIADAAGITTVEATAFLHALETVEGRAKGRGFIWTVK